MTILDHIEFAVRDAEASRRFYELALAPLDIVRVISVGPERTRTGGTRHGFGRDGYPSLWIHDNEAPGAGTHIAFAAQSRAIVDAFHQAALKAGVSTTARPASERITTTTTTRRTYWTRTVSMWKWCARTLLLTPPDGRRGPRALHALLF
ncbi:VOC family protein [Salinicola sp. MIT1003]|uniref:VOC family protein n=1 Tax=Salinicola sp. MIT1003 TaxID=1882734 RepID=UPI001FFCAB7E|nr:VOC family protein [Salinicola sp. MIT1003]